MLIAASSMRRSRWPPADLGSVVAELSSLQFMMYFELPCPQVSCAGSCTALSASLCPSGDCGGDCEMPLEQEINENGTEAQTTLPAASGATNPSDAFRWCAPDCKVNQHKGCCYNPQCRQKRPVLCEWINHLTGVFDSLATLHNKNLQGVPKMCLTEKSNNQN